MKAFPNLVAAAVLLLFAALLAPAALSLGAVVLGLMLGTVWMGAVYIALDRWTGRDGADRQAVPVRQDRRRGV